MLARLLALVALSNQPGGYETPRPQDATASTRPAGTRPFVPGIEIDWNSKEVRASGEVVLREGPLEFLACTRGKEHESLIRLRAPGTQLFMALGLIGLSPGTPPRWNDDAGRFDPAEGDALDIDVEWPAAGATARAGAASWIRSTADGMPALPRPWVFAGSIRRPDGRLACDGSGGTVALVDFPDNLIGLSRAHSSRNDELWAEANTDMIPPVGTSVTLVLRAARPRPWRPVVDELALARVAGRVIGAEDLADLITSSARIPGSEPVEIELRGTLLADQRRLERELSAAGVPQGAYRLGRAEAPGR